MQRVVLPTFVIAFASLMTYALYLQAKIWHIL